MDFYDWSAKIALKYHRDTVESMANKIAVLESMSAFGTIANTLKKWVDSKDIDTLTEMAGGLDLSPLECSSALRSAARTANALKAKSSIDMVWTGPSTSLVATRRTEQALLEVIDRARDRLFVVSFVAYKVETILKALSDALNRGVTVELLIESSSEHGGKISTDSIEMFKKKLPGAILYVWNDDEDNGYKGSVHAKCAVSDYEFAFITSANLTNAALDHNMELGVSIKGGDVPKRLHKHLRALVDTKVIDRIV